MTTEQRRNKVSHPHSDHVWASPARAGFIASFRRSHCYLRSCLAMTTRWIWLVPS